MKPDEGPPVQFASQSGHVLGDGEARKPRPATPAISPLFKQTAQLGKQVHYQEQARKITERNGYRGGTKIEGQQTAKPVQASVQEKRPYSEIRTDPITKKRIVTAKFGDDTFEFENAYTAEELFKHDPIKRAEFIANPHAIQMQKIDGTSGHYYADIKNVPEGYKSARNEATSIRFAKDVSDAASALTIALPEAALVTYPVGLAADTYVYYKEPNEHNRNSLLLSSVGAKPYRAFGIPKKAAERISGATQLGHSKFGKDKE